VKTIPSALQAHYSSGAHTLADCVKITRQDGQVFAFTGHDRPIELSGVTYEPTSVIAPSAVDTRAELNVDNLEVMGLLDSAGITAEEIEAGLWDGADVVLYRCNWAAPTDGAEIIRTGTIGQVNRSGATFVAEIRGLMQGLQVNIGREITPLCDATLGDARCGVNLPALAASGTVTGVTSRRVFTASALPGAAGLYDWGEVEWTSGDNDGRKQDVKTHASGGVITLQLPMGREIQVGDTFSVLPGCDKRHALVRDASGAVTGFEGDCGVKFDNVLNFRGFPAVPGDDVATKINGQ
jgi:uncharacterized phage protein (TIGR02218 family)